MKKEPLWYIRRGQDISGPFPVGQVERDILLNRIRESTELSPDSTHWKELLEWPEWASYLKSLYEGENVEEQLQRRRRWEDERTGYDRRANNPQPEPKYQNRRSITDRRSAESSDTIDSRQQRHQRAKSIRLYSLRAVAIPVAAVIVFVVTYLLLYKPPATEDRIDCSLAAAEAINWSHCDLQNKVLSDVNLSKSNLQSSNLTGAQLDQANISVSDLSFAVFTLTRIENSNFSDSRMIGVSFRNTLILNTKFDNANLTYADFSNAELENVSFKGARLDHAIWIDRRRCAQGSIGICR